MTTKIVEKVHEVEKHFGSLDHAPKEVIQTLQAYSRGVENLHEHRDLIKFIEEFNIMRENGYTRTRIAKSLGITPANLSIRLKRARESGLKIKIE